MITLETVQSFAVEEYLLSRLAFSPDGSEIAVGHKHFRTYAAESGAPRGEFAFPEFLSQLRYSPDGRFLAAANVGDNHPATRGRLELFDAATGRGLWHAAAPQPVEACAFSPARPEIYWNGGGAVAGAVCDPHAPLVSLPLPQLQIRGLAAMAGGIVCFGRESEGAVQQVEGADLIFRKFRLISLDNAGKLTKDIDLGIGAGVHALSPDGKLLAVEMVDFKNNERHVSLVDVDTGVEANLLPLEANTLPVLAFGAGSEYFLCMKEDAEANYNLLRIWRTSDLKLIGEAQVALSFHSLGACLEHSLLAFLGGGQLEIMALS
ncbi:MAG: WD40 repeat domain-containing protein [Terriglobales bacterium]|jgi:hypothetical protein